MKKRIALQQLVKRRKLIFSGLALALLSPNIVLAQDHLLKQKNQHRFNSQPIKKSANRPVVMLDPGHGGIDSEALGEAGLMEKQIVLDIAHPVKRLFNQHPTIKVHLTQASVFLINLYQRVEITHQHNASRFRYIHADGYTNPSALGALVFALSNSGAMGPYLSKREKDANQVGGVDFQQHYQYLQQILLDLLKMHTIKNSLHLGEHWLKTIGPIHRLHSGQTEQAAFAGLKSSSIPSVLVETSLITNPTEEAVLDSPILRKRITKAIS